MHTVMNEELEFHDESALSAILVKGNEITLENGAELPADYCIKSGHPSVRVVHKALRDPRKPLTWFGKRKRIPIGLSKKHYENHLIALTLTWSIFALGILLIVCGALTLGFFDVVIGAGLTVGSGVFRAISPVWSPRITEDHVVICGTGENFRKKLIEDWKEPERSVVEPDNEPVRNLRALNPLQSKPGGRGDRMG